ncbi:MAG: AbrB/MazE/SpoVT family DNA-binding domain-containing protein [archaeon]|nr:AbrB/MazE/SpoVT family DNA-binding domain-containing protein [archaeon]
MADSEERTVVIDRQGRMVLPSRLREKLGVKKGGRLSIKSEDSHRIIIEQKTTEDLKDRVQNWAKISSSVRGQVGSISGKKTYFSKWMSSEYARRKLGL